MVRLVSFRKMAAWRPAWRQGGELEVIAVQASDHESLQQWFSNCGLQQFGKVES